MFIAFECFYSKSCGVLDKNYSKACLRGVFANKLREVQGTKAFKRVYFCLCSFLVHRTYSP